MQDYKKIADLLFPDIKNDINYYESLYPKRQLTDGAMVTRFAPSPTGFMHLGNFFSSFFDYVIAKSTNGIFYFRLEDTDQQREVENADKIALSTLKSYDILPDEGLMPDLTQKGNYGPYIQSQRVEIYKTYAKYLVSIGKAFPCFCDKAKSKDEIKSRREESLNDTNSIEEHDVCRNLSDDDIIANLKAGKPFAIRLLASGVEGEKVKVYDLIMGEREIASNRKDIVILKSDFIPPYAFAHAVDDHLMKTTLVIRGADWFSSVASHIDVFKALGFDLIPYCHMPLLSKIADNGNKRKLSKRYDPEADMRYYVEQGYPKESVIEYLLTLANSNFEEWRLQNPFEHYSAFPFSVDKINASNPLFDIVKFDDVSKNVISKFSAEQVYDNMLDWAKSFNTTWYDLLNENKDYAIKMYNIDRNNVKPRKDITKWNDVPNIYYYFYDNLFNPDTFEDYQIERLKPEANKILLEYLNIFDENDDKNVWFERIKELGAKYGCAREVKEYKKNPDAYIGHCGDVCTLIRVALTSKAQTPDLYEILKLFGKERMKQRFEIFCKYCEEK